jgi:hypothetical protein
MSMDTDAQQRLWLSLGYGGKSDPPTTWRYWQVEPRHWVIAAPNDLAKFEQHDKTVSFEGEPVFTSATQWSATWEALAYFYKHVVPKLSPPPKRAATR